jgi:hypothetical protein
MNKRVMIAVCSFAILTIVLVYIIMNTTTSQVMLYVNPQAVSRPTGQNFTIDINIASVANLYGWQLKLRWSPTILNVTTVTEGSFLRSGGSTLFVPTINNTAGYILVDCTLLGNISGASGNGVLATIQFYVKGSGNSDLDLYDTILLNSSEQSITHTVRDGQFNAST